LSGAQIAYQIAHCQPRVVLISTAEQAVKLQAATFSPEPAFVSYEAVPGSPLRELSALMADVDSAALTPAATTPDSVATILYTSGTTGEPKGVMLSQHNLVSNTLSVLDVLPVSADDVRLNFLPLSHIFARTCDLYTWVAGGFVLALAESRATVLDDCAAVQPTLLNAVPYFYERLCRAAKETPDDAGALQRLLGGRNRVCCSGGAALPTPVYDYFREHNISIMQGYGLTESSPVITISTPVANKRGAVGRPIAGVEVSIAADGEILTRGPHVMRGYYRDAAATAQTVRNGWLYTGDLGHVDEEGFLHITGRKKEILVTLGGKNVAPVLLESLLTQEPLVHQAMVVGDGRKYLAALIVPDGTNLRAEILRQSWPITSPEQALSHPDVLATYAMIVRRQLSVLSHYEQVARFILLPRAFSIEQDELTPKLSLRREVIQRHFAREIEMLYDEQPSAAVVCSADRL
jgi:long-chain acyl-CoA synthetase